LPSFLKYFPQIDVEGAGSPSAMSTASNIQGITVGGYTLGCFFGAVATIWLGGSFSGQLAETQPLTISRQHAWSPENYFYRQLHHGRRRCYSGIFSVNSRRAALTHTRHEYIDCPYLAE
jgi:hypothetical protein